MYIEALRPVKIVRRSREKSPNLPRCTHSGTRSLLSGTITFASKQIFVYGVPEDSIS
jgi:hypothetical protein